MVTAKKEMKLDQGSMNAKEGESTGRTSKKRIGQKRTEEREEKRTEGEKFFLICVNLCKERCIKQTSEEQDLWKIPRTCT